MSLSRLRVTPETVAAKCIPGWQSVICQNLTDVEKQFVLWKWDWNMHSRCRAIPPVAAASGVAAAQLASGVASGASVASAVDPEAAAEPASAPR